MTYDEVLTQVLELLQRDKRVAYRVLKRRFELDDDYIEDLKADLIDAKELAVDKEGKVLVWVGGEESPPLSPPDAAPSPSTAQPRAAEAERRQLTVEFIDLVGSTALSGQLDPEELRDLVRAYQDICATVIAQYDGHIAQYLGDGLLVYFGYPAAHEDDAARAIRAGLGIVEALATRNPELSQPLQVRIGIHTGPVVVGEMGGGGRHEQLALGETPNIAARVQGQADPNSVVISAATARLVPGLFDWQSIGVPDLKGVSTLLELYHIQGEETAQSRFDVAVRTGLTPLVGRDQELGVLQERWSQAQAGNGQVVLLSGEPGIGKSRLVEELKAHITAAGATPIEFRCSPYHQNSALYPIIEHLQRLLQFTPDETPDTKLAKLQHQLHRYHFPQATTLPLLAALLSLPHPADAPPLTMSPEKQKELTQTALVAWLLEETEQQPVYNAWEDLHWADPSTLEVVGLMLSQVPTSPVLAVLTFRPEFVPPWGTHSYLSQLALSRLGQPQVNAMVKRVTGGKALPEEVLEQIVTKTDGVPLFVEELTKMVLESDLVRAVNSHYELNGPLPPLAIPSTLQDSLMARLDRLATVKEVAQLGATMGREFSYALLHAVSPLDETALQQGLQQLVEAELVFQRSLPPDARYLFKHALIQDTAYESLLKSRRQQLHQQVAQVLEQQFAETVATQPELVAHHYTEAGLSAQAIPYWQQAGERSVARSANTEAESHLTTGIRLLEALPDTPERAQQELSFQLALGPVRMAIKSSGHVDTESTYTRARELCQQLGETPQLFPVLWGLRRFYSFRAEYKTAREVEEQLLRLAQNVQDPALLLEAQWAWGTTSFWVGELVIARERYAHSLSLYNPQLHSSHAFQYGSDPGVTSRCYYALTLWHLGYPDKALRESQRSLTLAQDVAHSFSRAYALIVSSWLYYLRREVRAAQEEIEVTIRYATEQEFPYWVEWGRILQGWALALQGEGEEGIAQLRQYLATLRTRGQELGVTMFLAMLADTYRAEGQSEDGLQVLTEALKLGDELGERAYEAELYRLKGELSLQSQVQIEVEAEGCFQKAIEVARQQSAKSLELRAATSLARLWQQQGKPAEASALLAPVYEWFTEGFDTADLKDAKALLDQLS